MKLIRIENIITHKFTFKYIPLNEWEKIRNCKHGLIIKKHRLTAI